LNLFAILRRASTAHQCCCDPIKVMSHNLYM
jgi:hypothetical protein